MTAPGVTHTPLDYLLADVAQRVAELASSPRVSIWERATAADGTPWLIGRLELVPGGTPPLERLQLIERGNAGRYAFQLAWAPEGLCLDFRVCGTWVTLVADPAEGRCAA